MGVVLISNCVNADVVCGPVSVSTTGSAYVQSLNIKHEGFKDLYYPNAYLTMYYIGVRAYTNGYRDNSSNLTTKFTIDCQANSPSNHYNYSNTGTAEIVEAKRAFNSNDNIINCQSTVRTQSNIYGNSYKEINFNL